MSAGQPIVHRGKMVRLKLGLRNQLPGKVQVSTLMRLYDKNPKAFEIVATVGEPDDEMLESAEPEMVRSEDFIWLSRAAEFVALNEEMVEVTKSACSARGIKGTSSPAIAGVLGIINSSRVGVKKKCFVETVGGVPFLRSGRHLFSFPKERSSVRLRKSADNIVESFLCDDEGLRHIDELYFQETKESRAIGKMLTLRWRSGMNRGIISGKSFLQSIERSCNNPDMTRCFLADRLINRGHSTEFVDKCEELGVQVILMRSKLPEVN